MGDSFCDINVSQCMQFKFSQRRAVIGAQDLAYSTLELWNWRNNIYFVSQTKSNYYLHFVRSGWPKNWEFGPVIQTGQNWRLSLIFFGINNNFVIDFKTNGRNIIKFKNSSYSFKCLTRVKIDFMGVFVKAWSNNTLLNNNDIHT